MVMTVVMPVVRIIMGMSLSIHEYVVIRKEFFCVYSRGCVIPYTIFHTHLSKGSSRSLFGLRKAKVVGGLETGKGGLEACINPF